MYDVALTVAACLRAGTRVDVAWVVGSPDELSPDATEAVVLRPGGGRVGTLCGGVLDTQLAERAATAGRGRLLDLEIGELEAAAAGLRSGGRVQCLLVPAAELPEPLWGLLADRSAMCLVTRVSDGAAVETRLVPLFQRTYPQARVGLHATYMAQGRVVRVTPFLENKDDIDLWTPIGSLLREFRPSVEAYPARDRFMTPDPELVEDTLAVKQGLGLDIIANDYMVSPATKLRISSPTP